MGISVNRAGGLGMDGRRHFLSKFWLVCEY